MASDKISLEENLRNNFVIWAALVIGQVFFCLISVYLVKYGEMKVDQPDLTKILLYIVPIMAIICVFSSSYIFKLRLIALKDKTDLNAKFIDYRSALIVRWALLEGPSFFAIVSYLLTGNYFLLSLSMLIIIFFILIMPNKARLEADLELGWQDENNLN
jgi:hypothetical protein